MGYTDIQVVPGHVLDRGGVVVRRPELEELSEARRAIATAREEARSILASAEAEAEKARLRGYEDGLARARQEAAAAAVALRAEALRLRAEAGERLVRLAVDLARRVLKEELRQHPEALESLARGALSQVSWCQRVTLRLHPEDADRLRSAAPDLAQAMTPGAELRLEPDETLAPGSCLVETEAGELDGSVEVQLAALQEALLAEEPIQGPGGRGE